MHTYACNLLHCVFSTKGRRRCIVPRLRERLWAYLGGTARQLGVKALMVGGADDHVHMLLSLPTTISVAEAIQKIKANSSRWVRETFSESQSFQWQKGYGAFSVGISQVEKTITYIQRQEQHHRRVDYRQEFISFLKKHGIPLQDEI